MDTEKLSVSDKDLLESSKFMSENPEGFEKLGWHCLYTINHLGNFLLIGQIEENGKD